MKRLFYVLTASLCLASCSEELTQMPTESPAEKAVKTFTASLNGKSRTALGGRDENNQYPILWTEDNTIAVSNGTESARYVVSEGVGESSAKFTATGNAITEADTYYAYYPATGFNGYENEKFNVTLPANQTYTDESFGDNALPMVAVSNTTDFSFKQICGGLNLILMNYFGDTDVSISSIRISADEAISGTGTVEYNDGVPTFTFSDEGSRNHININCTDLIVETSKESNNYSPYKNVYVALPPGTYHNMVIEVITSDNALITNAVDWDMEIKRAKFSPLEVGVEASESVGLPTIDGPTFRSALSTAGASSCTSIIFKTNATELPADATIVTDGTVGITYDDTNTTASVHIVGPKALLTSGKGMFQGLGSLNSLDLTSLDTSLATDMSFMFWECISLCQLNIKNFNTAKVTNMSSMFGACFELTTLDLSNFDTSNVEDMNNMFCACNKLSALNIKSFNTNKVEKMYWMFGCPCLTTLDLSNFNTRSVTSMYGMFSSCVSLKSLDLSNFDTSNVTEMNNMFSGCDSMQSLDLSSFVISSTTTVTNMFQTTGANASAEACEVILSADAYSYLESLFESNTKIKYVEAK